MPCYSLKAPQKFLKSLTFTRFYFTQGEKKEIFIKSLFSLIPGRDEKVRNLFLRRPESSSNCSHQFIDEFDPRLNILRSKLELRANNWVDVWRASSAE